MVDITKLVEQSKTYSRARGCFRQGLEGDADAYMAAIDAMERKDVIGTSVHRILRQELKVPVHIDAVRAHLRGRCSCRET